MAKTIKNVDKVPGGYTVREVLPDLNNPYGGPGRLTEYFVPAEDVLDSNQYYEAFGMKTDIQLPDDYTFGATYTPATIGFGLNEPAKVTNINTGESAPIDQSSEIINTGGGDAASGDAASGDAASGDAGGGDAGGGDAVVVDESSNVNKKEDTGVSSLPTTPTGEVPIDTGLRQVFDQVVKRPPRAEDMTFYTEKYGPDLDFQERAELTRALRPEQLEFFDRQLGLPATVRRDAAGNIPTTSALDFSSFGTTPATAGIARLKPTDTTGTMAGVFANPQFTSPYSIQTEQQQLPDTFTQLGDLFGEQFKADLIAEAAEEAEGKRAGGLASLYKEGGKVGDAGLANIAQKMASYGRYGDTMLAHISPEEARMLKAMGGSGTRNPVTGLPEFFLKKLIKSVFKIGKKILPAVVAAYNPVVGASLAAADAGFKDGKFDIKDAALAGVKTLALSKAGEAIAGGPIGPESGGLNLSSGYENIPVGQDTASTFTIGQSLTEPFTDPIGFAKGVGDAGARIGSGFMDAGSKALGGDFSGLKGTAVPLTIAGVAKTTEMGLDEAEKMKQQQQNLFLAAEERKKRFRDLAFDAMKKNPFGYNEGGISSLPPRYLDGMGDGMSDSIKANIGGMQEARLADGEFVVPADVVADLGNGSSNAGAERLYSMMDRIRQARHGTTKQPPEVNVNKTLPA